MKNFKIRDLMVSVYPYSDKEYADDHFKRGIIPFKADCFANSKCSATKPDCLAVSKCSATKPPCNAISKCSNTKPPHHFGGDESLNQRELKHSVDLVTLKQILSGMQGRNISV